MINKKRLFQLIVALALFILVGITALYAQSNQTLQIGVYRYSGIPGDMRVVYLTITGSNGFRADVLVYAPDGSIALRGTARISGNRVNVDYGSQGFETWTIIDNQTFKDDLGGNTWLWVRNASQAERDQLNITR